MRGGRGERSGVACRHAAGAARSWRAAVPACFRSSRHACRRAHRELFKQGADPQGAVRPGALGPAAPGALQAQAAAAPQGAAAAAAQAGGPGGAAGCRHAWAASVQRRADWGAPLRSDRGGAHGCEQLVGCVASRGWQLGKKCGGRAQRGSLNLPREGMWAPPGGLQIQANRAPPPRTLGLQRSWDCWPAGEDGGRAASQCLRELGRGRRRPAGPLEGRSGAALHSPCRC